MGTKVKVIVTYKERKKNVSYLVISLSIAQARSINSVIYEADMKTKIPVVRGPRSKTLFLKTVFYSSKAELLSNPTIKLKLQ